MAGYDFYEERKVYSLKVEEKDGTTYYTEHVSPEESQEYIDNLIDGDKRFKWRKEMSLGDADEIEVQLDGTLVMEYEGAPWLRKPFIYTSIYHPLEV